MTKTWIEWVSTGTRVAFTVTPTLGTDDGGKPFCCWHDNKDVIQAWARENLAGEHAFFLGREDAEHFNCESIEFVFYGDEEDAKLVRAKWVKP